MYRVCIRFCQYLLIIKKQMQEKRYQAYTIKTLAHFCTEEKDKYQSINKNGKYNNVWR